MVFKSIIVAVGMYMSLLSFTAIGAPMYQTDATGAITGVTGLEVDGSIWDMTLHDGSFDELSATMGTDALYSNLFSLSATFQLIQFTNNNPVSDASLFSGCADFYALYGCSLDTVYDYQPAGNAVFVHGDMVSLLSVDSHTQIVVAPDVNYTNQTYATWQMSSVPVPAAVWLFGSGLLGLVAVARRKTA